MKIYAINNSDKDIRNKSSAGGAFSLIAENFINDGGVVYGVGFDENWNASYCRIDDLENLSKIRGSKYIFGNLKDSIKSVIADLKAGRNVLFSGTPCQIAAVSKIAKDYDSLLCAEVVCHGAPEPRYWQKYLNELCAQLSEDIKSITSINFRDKSTGWKDYSFTISFNNKKVYTEKASANLYMRAFLSDFTLREECFKCKFKCPDGSNADITLGDFWGIEKLAPHLDNNLGTTIAIAHNSKAKEILDKIGILLPISLTQICKYNPAISSPASKPIKYESFLLESASSDKIIPVMMKYTKTPTLRKIKNAIKHVISLLK